MFFNHPFFRQNFPGGHEIGAGGPFRAVYTCYSAAFLPDHDRTRLNVENGGKILLPQAALEQLIDQVKQFFFLIQSTYFFLIPRAV
jgi:IS4 transposase